MNAGRNYRFNNIVLGIHQLSIYGIPYNIYCSTFIKLHSLEGNYAQTSMYFCEQSYSLCVLYPVVFIKNNLFVSVNTTVQIKVITKVIYINDNQNIFRPLLGQQQVYIYVFRCSIFVQYGSKRKVGRTIAQTVSRWLATTAVRVRARV
jgi:hypothetical protein